MLQDELLGCVVAVLQDNLVSLRSKQEYYHAQTLLPTVQYSQPKESRYLTRSLYDFEQDMIGQLYWIFSQT